MNGGWLDDGAVGVGEVDSRVLMESFGHETTLLPFDSAVGVILRLE